MRRALLGSGEGEASEHDEAGHDMQPQDNGAMMYSFQGSTIRTEVFLGRGTYGAVYRAKSDCGRTYALKLAVRDDTIQDVGTESSYLCKARHPGVVCCYGLAVAVAVAKSPSVAMVMECAEASLLELLRHTQQHSMEARWQMTLQILRATEYIHSVDILHLDIKPNNILAWKKDTDGHGCPQLKLCDFGMAGCSGTKRRGDCVFTTPWRALELHIAGRREVMLTPAADLFAVGCVIFLLLVDQKANSHHYGILGQEHYDQISKNPGPETIAAAWKFRDLRLDLCSKKEMLAAKVIRGLVCQANQRMSSPVAVAVVVDRLKQGF